jgi:chromosomal replication initiator protein
VKILFISSFNELAFKALDNFSMERGPQTVIIYGGEGVGKSELLKRLLAKMELLPCKVIYYQAERFSKEYSNALAHGKIKTFRTKVRTADLFILDDIHKLTGKKRTVEELFFTYDSIMMKGGKFAISCLESNLSFDFLGERFASRLKSSITIPVSQPGKSEILEFIRYCNKYLFFGKIDVEQIFSKSTANFKNTMELLRNHT